jgi:hypothetical protein
MAGDRRFRYISTGIQNKSFGCEDARIGQLLIPARAASI